MTASPVLRIKKMKMGRIWKSVSQCFTNEQNFDPACDAAASCNYGLAADAVVAQAVRTHSGSRARRFPVQTDTVWRRRNRFNASNGVFYGRDDFIHTRNNDDLIRPIAQSGNPVAVAVDVNELSVHGNRICA